MSVELLEKMEPIWNQLTHRAFSCSSGAYSDEKFVFLNIANSHLLEGYGSEGTVESLDTM